MSNAYESVKNAIKELRQVRLEELQIIQGDLKRLSAKEVAKLEKSLIEYGFSFPFFAWEDDGVLKLLDGTQRRKVIPLMKEKGIAVPETFPCVIVDARDEQEAKKKILLISSQYGEMTAESLSDFAIEAGIDLEWLNEHTRFAEVDLGAIGGLDNIGESEAVEKAKMSDKFLIPPFSVFNAREGWWQERKAQWIALGIKSELGRGGGGRSSELQKSATLGCIPPNEQQILKRQGKYA